MEDSFEREMLQKIKNGERLSECELSTLVYEGDEVDEIAGGDTRWTRCMTTVINLCGTNVAIDWQKGLTECQDNEFYDQPYFVEKKERTVVVTDWEKISPDMLQEDSQVKEQSFTDAFFNLLDQHELEDEEQKDDI